MGMKRRVYATHTAGYTIHHSETMASRKQNNRVSPLLLLLPGGTSPGGENRHLGVCDRSQNAEQKVPKSLYPIAFVLLDAFVFFSSICVVSFGNCNGRPSLGYSRTLPIL